MKLLKESGIFVGHIKDLKRPDKDNPRGYFEYNEEHKLSAKLIKQADSGKEEILTENFSLNTKKLTKKLQRFITRIRMNKFLIKIHNQANDSWALKPHFITFPLWQAHIPNFKLIIVFRHPVITAHSNIKYKKFKRSFQAYISIWEKIYRELIYYYSRYPSIVISYDDLINSRKRDQVLQKLINFTGKGNIDNLKKVITPELDRSTKEINKLIEIYPLPQSTREVLETLEKLKGLDAK